MPNFMKIRPVGAE